MYREILTDDHREAARLVELLKGVVDPWDGMSLNALKMARDVFVRNGGQIIGDNASLVVALHAKLNEAICERARQELIEQIRGHGRCSVLERTDMVLKSTGRVQYLDDLSLADLLCVRKHVQGNPYPGDLRADIDRQRSLKAQPVLSDAEWAELDAITDRLEWLDVDDQP